MAVKKVLAVLAVIVALLVFLGGCNGVLFEKKDASGCVDRLRLDGGGDWDDYDITPRYYSQKSKDQDGYYMMLKSEKSF
jgi:hypothetical protein